MLCYVMLCYVMLCYVMLCYIMLWILLTQSLKFSFFTKGHLIQQNNLHLLTAKRTETQYHVCHFQFDYTW